MKLLLIIALLSLPMAVMHSQNDPFQRPLSERIETQRIAFITEKVQLTPEEAQSFWPIYNEFKSNEKDLRAQKKPTTPMLDMSEEQASAFLDKQISIQQQELDLGMTFTKDLRSVLSSKKVIMFFAAERQFKERLLKLMNKRRKK